MVLSLVVLIMICRFVPLLALPRLVPLPYWVLPLLALPWRVALPIAGCLLTVGVSVSDLHPILTVGKTA